MSALFGIHVGNTSACIALCKDDERIEVVANDTGDRLTPTIVQWTPDQSLVGRGALLEQFRHLTSTIIRNKQLLNDAISPEELEELEKKVAYKIQKKDSTFKYQVVFDGKQSHVSVREIAYAIFKKLYAIATTCVSSGLELQAVLTVPLHFTPTAIETVRALAEKAGFSVLQVIDEPSAAVLATVPTSVMNSLCVIFRIGGVSMDVTVVSIRHGMYFILASVHKFGVGGRNITEKLSEFLANEFRRQYKGQEIADRGKFKLDSAAESAKQILSIQNMSQCSAESIGGGLDLNCSVSRPRLDSTLTTVLNEVSASLENALREANVDASKVDKVILCGGSSKIPRIQEYIKGLLPKAEVFGTSGPDEVIAIGAATQARFSSKVNIQLPSTLALDVPVSSATISVDVKDQDDGEVLKHVIEEGVPLPLTRVISIPDKAANAVVSVSSSTADPVALAISTLSSLKLEVDREGLMKADLVSVKS